MNKPIDQLPTTLRHLKLSHKFAQKTSLNYLVNVTHLGISVNSLGFFTSFPPNIKQITLLSLDDEDRNWIESSKVFFVPQLKCLNIDTNISFALIGKYTNF